MKNSKISLNTEFLETFCSELEKLIRGFYKTGL